MKPVARSNASHILSVPSLSKQDVAALQALYSGEATEAQQRAALDCIITTLCGTYDEPYRDNDRDTIFALGKAHVGREIVTITKLPLGTMK